MNPLRYNELKWNLEAEGLRPVDTAWADRLSPHPPPSLERILNQLPCPVCNGTKRNRILFRDEAYDENRWFAQCSACGHCERL